VTFPVVAIENLTTDDWLLTTGFHGRW